MGCSSSHALRNTTRRARDVRNNFLASTQGARQRAGAETLCSLLRDLESRADVKAVDENPTVWQVHWAEVAWPTGPQLCTSTGERLWFKTAIRDVSGTKTGVWMNEKSALALSGLPTKNKSLRRGRLAPRPSPSWRLSSWSGPSVRGAALHSPPRVRRRTA